MDKIATVPVTLSPNIMKKRSYNVIVGTGIRSLAGSLIENEIVGREESVPSNENLDGGLSKVSKVAVVTQGTIPVDIEDLKLPVRHDRFLVPEGEGGKSFEVVEQLCRGFARFGLSRNDIVIALGGGVVCDVGGFASSCYMRGVRLINIPTTLLSQVDAAIGGKTGVNLPEGKNLAGAFFQPTAVLCDTQTLDTLPEEHWRNGYGEIAKYILLGAFIGTESALMAEPALMPIEEQIIACVSYKAGIVESDETEAGKRMVLNYGHTLAHALEAVGFTDTVSAMSTGGIHGESRGVSHGEAVGIGLVFAAQLAYQLGRIDSARLEYHKKVVKSLKLPTSIPQGIDVDALLPFMYRDKKLRKGAEEDVLTFVLDGPCGPEPVFDIRQVEVIKALHEFNH
ncbi:MAG: 3-dehydroquinate synthase [Actinobacteria bacterium]|nr:3-dehydroquinate synthase [Actinomycetota bacterium]MCL6104169.1 3-dehydroquinate synthase [Actinomycetota bacterium]